MNNVISKYDEFDKRVYKCYSIITFWKGEINMLNNQLTTTTNTTTKKSIVNIDCFSIV